jgi:hypothetical protein
MVGIELKDPKNRHYDPDPLIVIGRGIAADPEVNSFIHEFVKAKILYESNGLTTIQEQKFKELGLIDDTDFLLGLEQIYREGRNKPDPSQNIPHATASRQRKANPRSR